MDIHLIHPLQSIWENLNRINIKQHCRLLIQTQHYTLFAVVFPLLYPRCCWIYGFAYLIVFMYSTNPMKSVSIHNHEIGIFNARVNENHLYSVTRILHGKFYNLFEMLGK